MWRTACFDGRYRFYCLGGSGRCARLSKEVSRQDLPGTHILFMNRGQGACVGWSKAALARERQQLCAQELRGLWDVAVRDARNMSEPQLDGEADEAPGDGEEDARR